MDPPARITLKLHSSGLHVRAGESSSAAVEAIAAHKRRTAPPSSAAAASSSAAAAAAGSSSVIVSPAALSGSHFNIHTRGVLLPLPPTLTALRTAAMDEARSSPYWRALMSSAKAQRTRERAEEARRRRTKERASRKKARTDASSSSAAAAANGSHDDDERKTDSAAAAPASAAAADDEEDDGAAAADGNDSEADTASLPAHFPFFFRFFIDGGEVRNPASYSALVRDRDLIVVELSIQDATRTTRVPLESYVRDTTAAVAAAKAEGCGTVVQPLSSSAMVDADEAMEGERKANEAAAVGQPIARGLTSNAVATPRSKTAAGASTAAAAAAAGSASSAGSSAAPASSSAAAPSDQPHGTHKKPTIVNGAEVLICCSRDCTARASLGPCPHCHKLGHHKAYFCSQECFTRNWRKHSAEFHPETA